MTPGRASASSGDFRPNGMISRAVQLLAPLISTNCRFHSIFSTIFYFFTCHFRLCHFPIEYLGNHFFTSYQLPVFFLKCFERNTFLNEYKHKSHIFIRKHCVLLATSISLLILENFSIHLWLIITFLANFEHFKYDFCSESLHFLK